jgi:hypothetical protein
MSKYINVNPDHYKVAGRERPGNAVAKAPKQEMQSEAERARWEKRQKEVRSKKPEVGMSEVSRKSEGSKK